mgnify:CR=1 FL=1
MTFRSVATTRAQSGQVYANFMICLCAMRDIPTLKAEFFTPTDVRLAETNVRWVATVVHRAELMELLAP